jgi:hypothetical protein
MKGFRDSLTRGDNSRIRRLPEAFEVTHSGPKAPPKLRSHIQNRIRNASDSAEQPAPGLGST